MVYTVAIGNKGSQTYDFGSSGNPAKGTLAPKQMSPITSSSSLITIGFGSTNQDQDSQDQDNQDQDDAMSSGDPTNIRLLNFTNASLYFTYTDSAGTLNHKMLASNKAARFYVQLNSIITVSNSPITEEVEAAQEA